MSSLDYAYDYRGYYAYVLVNCSQAELDGIVRILKAQGLAVSKKGTSNYPAWDGRQYGWYIRVSDGHGNKPDRWQIHNILRSYSPETPAVPITSAPVASGPFTFDDVFPFGRPIEKPTTADVVSDTIVHDELQQAQHEIDRLEPSKRSLEEALSIAKADIDNLTANNDGLLSRVNELEAKLKAQTAIQETAPDEQQHQWQEYLEAESTRLEAEIEELRGKYAELRKTNDELKVKNAHLKFDLEEYRQQAKAPTPDEIALQVFQVLFPLVTPIKGTLQVLLREVDPKARGETIEQLRLLAYKPAAIKARDSIRSAKGWKELDIFGKKIQWRVYYKRFDGKFHVLLAERKTQEKDERYLADYQP